MEVTVPSALSNSIFLIPIHYRLIFWHGQATPPPDNVIQRYADLAPNNFEFRILDRLEMSEGTCLMDMREWTDEDYRKEMNMKPPSLSNLSRLLILTKVSPFSMQRKSRADTYMPALSIIVWWCLA